MRKFSRYMPPLQYPPTTLGTWLILGAFLACMLACAIAWPIYMGLILSALALFIMIANFVHKRYLRRRAAQRMGEDIGTFARAFDRHTEPFDPWVIRATWDALQLYVTFPGGRVPLRPTDWLVEDLLIDPEDIENLMRDVAKRSERSFANLEANPYSRPIYNVGDFVRFITRQPLLGEDLKV